MKRSLGIVLAVVVCGLVLPLTSAWGQGPGGGGCRQGGGGGGTSVATTSLSPTLMPTIGTGTILTGPGSAYQQDMLAQQMRAAYLQQQYAIAAAKAAKEQERRDRIKSYTIARREAEQEKKSREIAQRLASTAVRK